VLDEHAVRPHRVFCRSVAEPRDVDVHATQVQPCGRAAIQLAVQGRERGGVGRAVDEGDQVEVADPGPVVTGGE
jgi:hypothetical protein